MILRYANWNIWPSKVKIFIFSPFLSWLLHLCSQKLTLNIIYGLQKLKFSYLVFFYHGLFTSAFCALFFFCMRMSLHLVFKTLCIYLLHIMTSRLWPCISLLVKTKVITVYCTNFSRYLPM
jgi:hypothetical protein